MQSLPADLAALSRNPRKRLHVAPRRPVTSAQNDCRVGQHATISTSRTREVARMRSYCGRGLLLDLSSTTFRFAFHSSASAFEKTAAERCDDDQVQIAYVPAAASAHAAALRGERVAARRAWGAGLCGRSMHAGSERHVPLGARDVAEDLHVCASGGGGEGAPARVIRSAASPHASSTRPVEVASSMCRSCGAGLAPTSQRV